MVARCSSTAYTTFCRVVKYRGEVKTNESESFFSEVSQRIQLLAGEKFRDAVRATFAEHATHLDALEAQRSRLFDDFREGSVRVTQGVQRQFHAAISLSSCFFLIKNIA